MNFVHTNWEAMDSNDSYELNSLNLLSENDFEECLSQNNKKQLDIFLTNNPCLTELHHAKRIQQVIQIRSLSIHYNDSH